MAANGAVPTASPTRTAAAAAAAPPATGAAAVLPAKKKSRQPLRILCFGDSLTAGTTSWGSHYHPYGPRMGEVLSERLGPSGFDVMPTVDGRPGDMTVTPPGLMVERMQADCELLRTDYRLLCLCVRHRGGHPNLVPLQALPCVPQLERDSVVSGSCRRSITYPMPSGVHCHRYCPSRFPRMSDASHSHGRRC